jgi:tyrosyl-tRNA synthetase
MAIDVLADLGGRELIAQMTAEQALAEHLLSPRTVYSGFDPTADSLHIGSLVPLLALRRFQQAGHKPIVLVGGATGLIGDPSFKAEERKLNSPDVVGSWVEKLKSQTSRFVDFDAGVASAEVVNNLDWTANVGVLDFLRDVGKHFSINNMIGKESVKQRIEREGEGISFTEFTYMILQSYDFAQLYKNYGCTLQIGGSDQWGNITGGIDLTRRLHHAQVFGITLPLVTKADGTKFGKTESGTVWLDPAKTSPYSFYQFWLNTADADAYRFLRYFTFLSPTQIADIEQTDAVTQGRKSAQGVLAAELTELVHGQQGLSAALRISVALFSGDVKALAEADLQQLQLDGLPYMEIAPPYLAGEAPLTQLFVEAGLAKNGKQVKDALSRNAVLVNGEPVNWEANMDGSKVFALVSALFGKYFVVRVGKKSYGLFSR